MHQFGVGSPSQDRDALVVAKHSSNFFGLLAGRHEYAVRNS